MGNHSSSWKGHTVQTPHPTASCFLPASACSQRPLLPAGVIAAAWREGLWGEGPRGPRGSSSASPAGTSKERRRLKLGAGQEENRCVKA